MASTSGKAHNSSALGCFWLRSRKQCIYFNSAEYIFCLVLESYNSQRTGPDPTSEGAKWEDITVGFHLSVAGAPLLIPTATHLITKPHRRDASQCAAFSKMSILQQWHSPGNVMEAGLTFNEGGTENA